jgi:hypothetical protein
MVGAINGEDTDLVTRDMGTEPLVSNDYAR